MITSNDGRRWGFPKGIVEGGDSHEETALKEVLEEAGLHGRIVGPALGTYRYQKWGTELDVVVYLMEVSQVDEDWQEAQVRQREWASPEIVTNRIANEDLSGIFDRAMVALQARRHPGGTWPAG
jgi:phosphohistidine phosphatase